MANETKTKAAEPATKTEKVKMVTIALPKISKDQPDMRVCCNGERFLVKRGVQVEVPDFVAEIISHSEEMRLKAME
jgi:hypothetical protein